MITESKEVKILLKCLLPVPYSLVAPPIRGKCKFVSWDKRFVDPIAVPGRKPLVTLPPRTSPNCPMAEHAADEWQAAMEALLLVAEQDGPPLFARIGIMRAINRHVERVFDPSRKDMHCGTPKLKKDQ